MSSQPDDKPHEEIRKNWNRYKSTVIGTPLYLLLWESFETKLRISEKNKFYSVLKGFIRCQSLDDLKKSGLDLSMEDEKTLIFKGLESWDRSDLHLLCDKVGLHHVSKGTTERNLYVYKPDDWSWEYTSKNPYPSLYRPRKKHYCSECGITSDETDIMVSVYIRGFYCEDCLENTSDGAGGLMSDHKFEPL